MTTVTFDVPVDVASDIRAAVARIPTVDHVREQGATEEQVAIFIEGRDLTKRFCQPGPVELELDVARRSAASLGVSAFRTYASAQSMRDLEIAKRLGDFAQDCGRITWHAMSLDEQRETVRESIETGVTSASSLREYIEHRYGATPEQLTALFSDYDESNE